MDCLKFNHFSPQSGVEAAVTWIFVINTSNCLPYFVYLIIFQKERGIGLPIYWAAKVAMHCRIDSYQSIICLKPNVGARRISLQALTY